ncbi:hypothetical protein AB0L70_39450 [Kribbella sp. NPDC051952]|uniref:hypothetical protein n=1 Tax=Kribbella sp. NPDC051952 TaxID=3154851 RepID=UPI00344361D5
MPNNTEAAARELLAGWLAQHSVAPDSWSPETIADWRTTPVEEWLAFVPPGIANRVFLVADGTVFSFAPSRLGMDEALTAARAERSRGSEELER